MPRYRYYYEYCPEDGTYDVIEEDGGQEHGHYYDVLLFSTLTEQDAQDAVDTLVKLAAKLFKKG